MLYRKTIKTVKDLREYLDAQEATWQEIHQEYLGDFDLQTIVVPYYTLTNEFRGLGPPEISLWTTCDFTLEAPKAWLMEQHNNELLGGDVDES